MKGTVQLDERPDTAQRTSDRKIRSGGLAQRLNALRAGVLGANDGIVSTAAVVVGVAGATTDAGPILMAGLAAAVGGAVSMALGEYVSVSSQRDSERHLIEQQSQALRNDPEGELLALARSYEERGISAATARRAAEELFASNALEAQMRGRHNIDPDEVTSSRSARCCRCSRSSCPPPSCGCRSRSARPSSAWPSPARSQPGSVAAPNCARQLG